MPQSKITISTAKHSVMYAYDGDGSRARCTCNHGTCNDIVADYRLIVQLILHTGVAKALNYFKYGLLLNE